MRRSEENLSPNWAGQVWRGKETGAALLQVVSPLLETALSLLSAFSVSNSTRSRYSWGPVYGFWPHLDVVTPTLF